MYVHSTIKSVKTRVTNPARTGTILAFAAATGISLFTRSTMSSWAALTIERIETCRIKSRALSSVQLLAVTLAKRQDTCMPAFKPAFYAFVVTQ